VPSFQTGEFGCRVTRADFVLGPKTRIPESNCTRRGWPPARVWVRVLVSR